MRVLRPDLTVATVELPAGPGVLAPLPRRRPFETGAVGVTPTSRTREVFHASVVAALWRLLVCLYAAARYATGSLIDRLRRRHTRERQARRLRRVLERIGGTFLKLGQQMSIRIDLLPWATCMELSKLLDRVPPFATDTAIEIIERATGKKLEEIFAVFDPEPIGSASMACVYQGVLKDGRKVAVKVRRPGIAETFAADRRALSWIAGLAEFLTIVRPRQLTTLLRDLETMFLEELDFRREARYTDLFRRGARGSHMRFISAPRVLFELSSHQVLVTEFITGIWLWELLWAVESQDRQALAYADKLGIDPRVVAQRLFKASLFGIFENLIFHADPHPANVVVRPGGEIVLIDFGSCGSYTENQLHAVRQFHYCQANEDVSGMVQCVLALLEPLPPIDVDALTKEVEGVFADSLHALKSGHCEWWERTSAGVWIGFMRTARKYQIQIDLDTLRMIRSTLLYDTLAARLWGELDVYREYRQYRKLMAAAARQRFRKRLRRLWKKGIDDRVFLRWEELVDLGNRVTYHLQRTLDSPTYRFTFLAGKAVFAISSAVHWLVLSLTAGGIGVAGLALSKVAAGEPLDPAGTLAAVAGSPWYLGLVGLLAVVNVRRVLFRFGDHDG